MRTRLPLALALLSALTGCVAAPPSGPLVEYYAGLTPITRPVKCPGTYALYACDQPPASAPLLVKEASEGERIGFRREADGSVTAIARGHDLPLPPGAYSWELVPGTVAPWRDRLRAKAGADVGSAVQTTGIVIVAVGAVAVVIGLKVLYAYAQGGH